jgi:hypothetical protein
MYICDIINRSLTNEARRDTVNEVEALPVKEVRAETGLYINRQTKD